MKKVLYLRVPKEVKAAVEKLAKAGYRSTNKQAEYLLTQELKKRGRL